MTELNSGWIRLTDEEIHALTATERTQYLRYLKQLEGPSQEAVFAQLGYMPTARQWEFHRATEFDVLYGGAAGGGKSKAIVMHAIWAAIAYPGINIGIFRRTYPELQESIIRELASVGFGEHLGFKWNGTAHEMRHGNGSIIRLRYLETLVDASRRQGGEYQMLCIDERTLMGPGLVDIVSERLRTTTSSNIPVLGIRSTSNPGGASHSEVKRRYVDATNYGEAIHTDAYGHSVRFIPARVFDNPHVDAGYLQVLQSIPDPARRAAMLDGSWDSFAGQVFGEWNHDRHIIQPFSLPESWSRYMGVDWGYTAPFCALWGAEDEDGRLYVYRELYRSGMGEHEQARLILESEVEGEAPYRVGDPAMAAKRGDAESITTAYEREGVYLEPANNDRLGGWARVHHYLADGPACLHHRQRGLELCPRIHVFSTCADLIRTLPALPYSTTKVEDVDTKAEDHAPDALRYMLMNIGTRAEMFIPDASAVVRPTLHRDFGPYALPPGDNPAPWLTPR